MVDVDDKLDRRILPNSRIESKLERITLNDVMILIGPRL